MNIVGQGGKIILFMTPSLLIAIYIHLNSPSAASLPAAISLLRPLGYLLLLGGIILWGTALIQLLIAYSGGKLLTTGAYGIVRNPIYASAACFILPGITLLTMTWVYLVVSLFLYLGVMIFIGKEEKKLQEAFGKEYAEYLRRVDRLIPFKKPRSTTTG